jgi:tRNA 2-thiocytidine biosynthesis protein TtcA
MPRRATVRPAGGGCLLPLGPEIVMIAIRQVRSGARWCGPEQDRTLSNSVPAKSKQASIIVQTVSNRWNRLRAEIRGQVGRAIGDYRMISDGDHVMVCVSGGKDSYTLLDMLLELKRRAPIRFELTAVNLDQKQPNFPPAVLPAHFESIGVDYRIVEEDTYSIVKQVIEPGKTLCGLCSRLRRGVLYRVATEIGADKIALGHHRDDIVETLFLNLFYGARLKAMPPKLISDDSRHIVIRPLAYCSERDIARYARGRKFPIIPCDLCGSQQNLKRQEVKRLLQDWEQQDPGRTAKLFRAIQNVTPSHLADRSLYDFESLESLLAQADLADIA